MDTTALAGALAATRTAEVQMAIAGKIAKMNVDADKSVATLMEAASQNLQQVVAAAAPGTGTQLDIRV